MTVQTYECPNCGHEITHAESGQHRSPVCPNCGARIELPHVPNEVDVAPRPAAAEELYSDRKERETNI